MLPPGEKILETKKCRLSGLDFVVTDKDMELYEKVSPLFAGKKYLVTTPTLCPEERLRRKMCFRNERTLYKGSCDATKKEIVSIYPPDKKFTVYDHTLWWRDSWSGLDYGHKFDFSKTFFEQFHELQKVVPRPSLFGKNNENCPYTNHCDGAKNCHICTSVGRAESIYYSDWIVGSRDCCDCYQMNSCEKTYQSLFVENLYSCTYALHSKNCSDCRFIYDCQWCKNCFLCANLRNREFCIKNIQYTPEEYVGKISQITFQTSENTSSLVSLFHSFIQEQPHICHHIINSENSIGDFISNSKNIIQSHMIWDSENLRHCFLNMELKDSIDTYESGFHCDTQIEAHACNHSKRIGFSNISYEDTDVWYSDLSHNVHDCFWCIGLHSHEHHCILNTAYWVQEYEKLCGKIIDHMRSTDEWWEFFPHELSPFGYNETVAQEYFPLTQKEVEWRGWNWHHEEEKMLPKNIYQPLSIGEYDEKRVWNKIAQKNIDEVLNGIIRCEVTGKPFRVIKQELAFYIENHLPVPTKHPDQRHAERMSLRNPRTLYERVCHECQKNIITTYSPDRPEKVVCEECYRKFVY